jgi:hypothetical protein
MYQTINIIKSTLGLSSGTRCDRYFRRECKKFYAQDNSPGSTVTVPDAGEGAGAVLAINLVVSTPISPTSLFCLECNSIPLR